MQISIRLHRYVLSSRSSNLAKMHQRTAARNMPPAFYIASTEHSYWSVYRTYFGKTLQRIITRGVHNKRGHSSQQTRRQTSGKCMRNTVSQTARSGDVFAAKSTKAHSPLPRGLKAVGRLSSLAGDEIRYFVKVISPRKVSFRRVIAPAPFPPTATVLHAARAREATEREKGRRDLMKAERLVLPEEISHFGLRQWWTEGWG